jgi:predicted ABC-type sugar transport system permease subunit
VSSAPVSQFRIPPWIAVLAVAVILAAWTLVFAQLIGNHVTAVSGGRAAATLTAHEPSGPGDIG